MATSSQQSGQLIANIHTLRHPYRHQRGELFIRLLGNERGVASLTGMGQGPRESCGSDAVPDSVYPFGDGKNALQDLLAAGDPDRRVATAELALAWTEQLAAELTVSDKPPMLSGTP